MPTEREQSLRGLKKLMLRLPALRGQLQILSARNPDLLSICGAFDEASNMLDGLRSSRALGDPTILKEYEQLCADLEQEVIGMCLNDG